MAVRLFSERGRQLAAVSLVALPVCLLGACSDDVNNHHDEGDGGAQTAPEPTSGQGGDDGSAGEAGRGQGGSSESEAGRGQGGAGPVVVPIYPGAPVESIAVAQQQIVTFDIGNRYWFAVSEEQRAIMNEGRFGGGTGAHGDPYSPGDSPFDDALLTFVDHLWVTTAGEDPQTADYGQVQVKVVGQSTRRPWDEDHIPSLNVDTNQFISNQRIGGYEHLRFANAQVGTIFREHMMAKLFEHFGYPTALTTYAWVSSNVWGADISIPYVVVERYKQRFCERFAERFGGGCTNMWEFAGDFLQVQSPAGGAGGESGAGPVWGPEQPSIFDDPENCQLDQCTNTRVKQLEAKLADTPRGAGFKSALSDYIDWPAFHTFQCLSWMLWIGDDALHNFNNVVLVERADGLFQYLPYSIDISLGHDWYRNTPLQGANVLAQGCQADSGCWSDTIATCDNLIGEFEDMNPREMLEEIYDELAANGMLRDGDDYRYEMLDAWFVERLAGLRTELDTYRGLGPSCEWPMVDCGDHCAYQYCPSQCIPELDDTIGSSGDVPLGGAGGAGPEPCPVLESYTIAP